MNRSDITEPPGRTTTVAKVDPEGFTDADGWSLSSHGTDLLWLGVKAGDIVEQWGRGIGHVVRGCAIAGHVLWYRTEAEEQQRHAEWVADKDAHARQRFEDQRAVLDATYDAMPEVFRRRIDRFRAGNPDFRWRFEGYELAACEAALIIAEGGEQDPRIDELGLSGNQFEFAKRLAHWYLTEPENVVLEHGAMAPLTGCEAYGCTHTTPVSGGAG